MNFSDLVQSSSLVERREERKKLETNSTDHGQSLQNQCFLRNSFTGFTNLALSLSMILMPLEFPKRYKHTVKYWRTLFVHILCNSSNFFLYTNVITKQKVQRFLMSFFQFLVYLQQASELQFLVD